MTKHIVHVFTKGRELRGMSLTCHPYRLADGARAHRVGSATSYTGLADEAVSAIANRFSLKEVSHMLLAGHFGGRETSCKPTGVPTRMRTWEKQGFKKLCSVVS